MTQLTDLGQKFTCFKCECKFYDLGAPEPNCPRCGADQRENPELDQVAAPKKRASSRKTAKPKKAAASKATTKAVAATEEEGDSLLDENFDDSSVQEGLEGAVADRLPEDVKDDKTPPAKKAK